MSQPTEWLTDTGSSYTARDPCNFARYIAWALSNPSIAIRLKLAGTA